MSRVFPEAVVTAETRDFPGEEALFAEELAQVSSAMPARLHEFAAGRWCARRALEVLGVGAKPILIGDQRAPIWPGGFVGTISHSEGYCGAAAARSADFRSIGFDAEREPVEPALTNIICTAAEASWLACHDDVERERLLRILFSAKEAAFKAQFPVTERYLEFQDVEISLDLDAQTFSACISLPRREDRVPIVHLPGRFLAEGGLTLTGVVWPRENRDPDQRP